MPMMQVMVPNSVAQKTILRIRFSRRRMEVWRRMRIGTIMIAMSIGTLKMIHTLPISTVLCQSMKIELTPSKVVVVHAGVWFDTPQKITYSWRALKQPGPEHNISNAEDQTAESHGAIS